MRNYIIGSINSVGIITNYIDDGSRKLIVSNSLEETKEYLASIKEESPAWADFEIMEIVLIKGE